MLYKIRVVEKVNEKFLPIKGASVRFIGMQGQTLVTMLSDADGYAFINDETDGDLLFSGVNISITKSGYNETRFPSETIEPDWWAILAKKPSLFLYGLKVATVTAVGLILLSTNKYELD